MWTLWNSGAGRFCDGLSRRNFLRIGALGAGGLGLADVLRLRAAGKDPAAAAAGGSVIMIVLPGGPSHIDMYDMKPDAPAEFRGEFKPIRTNVAGFDVCDQMPLQAKIADKFSIIRGVEFWAKEHNYNEIVTGFPPEAKRPAFGSVISRIRSRSCAGLPAFVSLKANAFGEISQLEDPAYLGAAHRPFIPQGTGLDNLSLCKGIEQDRLADRRRLLRSLDTLRRDADARGDMAGLDAFEAQALEMIASPKARNAFDVSRESDKVRDKYGPKGEYTYYGSKNVWDPTVFLQARRLAEAGVPIVTLSIGHWDHHSPKNGIFSDLRTMLPLLDRSLHALITDLYERGLDKRVTVLVWGEMGRTPRVNKDGGRDHWPSAGCAMLAGGGLKMGQVVGETDARADHSKTRPYTPQNILATLYQGLGIDPAITFPDHFGRPQYILDDRDVVSELV